ncbi:phage minor capsid protein [Weissella tructae]|uniref:phage minor capsid protein n=1 Tax=Weissella tructae TaxID=887702 RepID=UPI003D8D1E17
MDKMLSKSEKVGRLYADMSQELLLRMIQRIKQRATADLQSDPYLWHLDKLRDMHALNESNIKYVVEQTGVAREIIDDVLQHEGLAVYEDSAKRVSKDTGKPIPSYNGVKDTLSAYASQAFLEVDNLVNQTLLSRNVDTNPVMRVYQDILTKAVSDVVNGLRSPEQAVSRAVMDWVNKGIPSGFIDKAGRKWNIESYVNSVMTSTTYRVYNEMRAESAKDLGVDTFHMSAHSAARPNCAPIQGHIVTTGRDFQSKDKDVGYVYSLPDYGYGRPDGTLGINCRHVLTPFVIGVNELPDEDIPSEKEAIANGKKQAQQRSFERGIRNAKKQLTAAKALGDDKLISHYRELLNRRRGGLSQLINDNDFLH